MKMMTMTTTALMSVLMAMVTKLSVTTAFMVVATMTKW